MLSIVAILLLRLLSRRGSRYQVLITGSLCVLGALLLIPAWLWFHLRMVGPQTHLSASEIWGILVYVFVCSWLIPLLALLAAIVRTRAKKISERIHARFATQEQSFSAAASRALQPPHYQPGTLAPFVFGEDTPWGWLEYKNGNFQGQRLALKRAVATLGRDENCDIWLDDEMASRHHAELAWYDGKVCLTDCGSLNGLLLNGQPVQGTVLLEGDNLFEIGSQQFCFLLAEQQEILKDQYDPLVNHTWRSMLDLQGDSNISIPLPSATVPGYDRNPVSTGRPVLETDHSLPFFKAAPQVNYLLIKNGERAGQRLMLEGSIITIGSGDTCSIQLKEPSIEPVHMRVVRVPAGFTLYNEGNSTLLNGKMLHTPPILQVGDVLSLGNLQLEYGVGPQLGNTTMPPIPITKSMSGPVPLRLPSKIKPV
ncbi:FHA domain-containing protein [Dictyobacter arantiisoli]|uniref:FHA domain-containing protein n=1 Tax=Dictyobacter arantiisoli TaxID=2014874 RepID=A0A5A5TE84_9CHLR|nr:FHA domain-containing protein [Dictyobacter arantiisoli]GCF09860.1 hypothetical protein KDI_34240 [Dictyobacter arantiisoli]